jgi:hypothetical protein
MLLVLTLITPLLMATSTSPEPVVKAKPPVEKIQLNAPYEQEVRNLAVKIESLMSSAIIKPEFEDEYLKSTDLPVVLRENFKLRYKSLKDINKMKELGRVKESGNGFLEVDDLASVDDKDKVRSENSNRAELYNLIASTLNINDEKDKARIPFIYSDVISNIKDYTFAEDVSSAKKINENIITSTPTIYKYDMVKNVLFKTLKEQAFEYDTKEQKNFNGSVTVNYKCNNAEKRSFILKLCQIKDGKLNDCKNSDEASLYSTISDGSMVWVEKGVDKKKTLVIPDTRSEDQYIRLCPTDEQDFGFIERLSNNLILEEEQEKIRIQEEKKKKAEEAKKKALKNKKSKDKKGKKKK